MKSRFINQGLFPRKQLVRTHKYEINVSSTFTDSIFFTVFILAFSFVILDYMMCINSQFSTGVWSNCSSKIITNHAVDFSASKKFVEKADCISLTKA